ncbi:MAG: cytochrome b/b6 domain-containing protein [Steroidobacteraceae bacterium]|nr:cytochrome b/b6 domain-containing protein [Steroidobacteraceae bacterium]
MSEEKRLVWDLPLRLFHWLLVLSIAGLWATGEAGFDWMQIHIYLGYWTLGLVVFRILWGFVGPRHARFSSFLKGPAGIWRYAKGLAAGTMIQTAGHNPLGGISVIVMLALVAFQATTGLFATDDILWTGPYNSAVSTETADRLTSLHHANFNLILAMVSLHVLAIVFYFFVKKQNLIGAMFHGKKPAAHVPEHEAITRSELTKAVIVIAISAGLVYWLISAAPPPPETYF